MDKTGMDWNGLHSGKFEKRRPTLFQIYIILYQSVSYTSKIILSCYVAVILQMKRFLFCQFDVLCL